MSTWTQADVDAIRNKRQATIGKASKYRNVKVIVNGEKFDSKREAAYYSGLRIRERLGDISDLSRQYALELCCPHPELAENSLVVAHYIADFRHLDLGTDTWVYTDAKGHRTALYQLKKKWVFLQYGIEIVEV